MKSMKISDKISVIFFLSLAFWLCPFLALAHQPRLVQGGEVTLVQNPEISQAFYGELLGQAQVFEIDANGDFNLAVSLLVPQVESARKDLAVEIYRSLESDLALIAALDGPRYDWSEFYEPFGGNNYWQGPAMKEKVVAGKYVIRVFSPSNLGKYVLVFGEQENFSLSEIVRTVFFLPQLKADFFDRSAWTAYFNYAGLFLLSLILVLAGLIYLVMKLVKKKRSDF